MSKEKLKKGQETYLKRVINELKKEFYEFLDSAKNKEKEIEMYKISLLGEEGKDEQETIEVKIKNALEGIQDDKNKASEKFDEIKDFHKKVFEGDEENEALEKELNETLLHKSEFDEYYEKIFGIKDNETGKILGGLKNELNTIQKDLNTKRGEVDNLLHDSTVATLTDGYTESKHEYSIPSEKKMKEWTFKSVPYNIYVNFFNILGRRFGLFFNYLIFILPLIALSWLFMSSDALVNILKGLTSDPAATELMYAKTIISVPLVWIAWYGQRNISQRKRLFEEYNHKLRVVQIYTIFTTKEDSYKLDQRKELENTLIEAIRHNPAEVFGKDETILDKLAGLFISSKKVIKGTVSEVLETMGKRNISEIIDETENEN